MCLYVCHICSYACILLVFFAAKTIFGIYTYANTYVYVCVCSHMPIHMCMYVYVFACITYICIYMHICVYICMYVYVCVCIPIACYNNTIFGCIFIKPRWLSGRYGLIWLRRHVFELQLRQRRFIQALIFFWSENFNPETSRMTGFLVKPWSTTKICIQAHTCKYIHVQSDTYQYMQIHAHICNTLRYRSIHTYTCIYIHIQQIVDANTDT